MQTKPTSHSQPNNQILSYLNNSTALHLSRYLAASPEAWPPGMPGWRWPSCHQWWGWGPCRPGLQLSVLPSSPDRWGQTHTVWGRMSGFGVLSPTAESTGWPHGTLGNTENIIFNTDVCVCMLIPACLCVFHLAMRTLSLMLKLIAVNESWADITDWTELHYSNQTLFNCSAFYTPSLVRYCSLWPDFTS